MVLMNVVAHGGRKGLVRLTTLFVCKCHWYVNNHTVQFGMNSAFLPSFTCGVNSKL